ISISISLTSATAASVDTKGRYPQATDGGKSSSKTISRVWNVTEMDILLMAVLRTPAPLLFECRGVEPQDRSDSVQERIVMCERPLPLESLSSACNGRDHFVEKYSGNLRRRRYKRADANYHRKYHRRLQHCPCWSRLYRIRCRRRRV